MTDDSQDGSVVGKEVPSLPKDRSIEIEGLKSAIREWVATYAVLQRRLDELVAENRSLQSELGSAAEDLTWLREQGWSVAVHNDYRLGGKFHTFWLLTHPSGFWFRGEGLTDREALHTVRAAVESLKLSPGSPQP